MREIKFKFYDKKTKKLVEECDMWWNYSEGLNKDDVFVCEFTGIKDKNGKEIYEDDVVQTYFDNGNERVKVKVFFQNGRFELNNNSNEVKLIGNIYENPELLDSEKGEIK